MSRLRNLKMRLGILIVALTDEAIPLGTDLNTADRYVWYILADLTRKKQLRFHDGTRIQEQTSSEALLRNR